jgi:hypothetical protein
MTTSPIRLAPVVVAMCMSASCVYEADIEPTGSLAPRRASIVGVWVCSTEERPSWATLAVGWQEDGYLLTLRPIQPVDEGADEPPWVVSARPRRVGSTEIWSLWSDQPEPSALRFTFVRVEEATGRSLKLASLGDGSALPARLRDISAVDLARLLLDTKETVADCCMVCRRPDGV